MGKSTKYAYFPLFFLVEELVNLFCLCTEEVAGIPGAVSLGSFTDIVSLFF